MSENAVTEMTSRKEYACDNLLLVCRRIQKRFADGHVPTFEQMDAFNAAIEAFDLELLCGHKIIEECECIDAPWNTVTGANSPKRLPKRVQRSHHD